jgi:hypothetical protein
MTLFKPSGHLHSSGHWCGTVTGDQRGRQLSLLLLQIIITNRRNRKNPVIFYYIYECN